jgi:Zn ribbon nucleic-acid-binding protein
MLLICGQNQAGLRNRDNRTIVGWMHGDEPDNAQALPKGQKGYGPPILPEKIVTDYKRIKETDPTRPVMLNLGQGVAWDGYYGRGVRTNKPEDYPQYLKGCDIASFDIYPVVHDKPAVAGNLWYVARGVERLRQWTEGQKPVWCCIECTHISNENKKATPQQVRSEVWMALIHGANGLIYFCHEFKPRFIEAGLLADPEMAKGVGAINAQIKELAPVLNSPAVADGATAASSNADVPVAVMTRRHGEATYVFAVAMRDAETSATFNLPGLKAEAKVEVLGENRSIDAGAGQFTDAFKGYAVHLYRVR